MAKRSRETTPLDRREDALLRLSGAAHEIRRDKSYFYDAKRRKDAVHVCLQLTLRGTGFYEDRAGRVLLPAGCAFLQIIPGPFRYGFAPESNEPYEHVFLTLTGGMAMREYARLIGAFGHVLRFSAIDPISDLMLGLMRQSERGQLADRYLVSAQLYHLLMTIHSVLRRPQLQTSARARAAIELIKKHGHEASFGVHELAEALDCSREYLSRQFRDAAGMSPSDYLLQHRLKLAAKQLRGGDEKLSLIAKAAGFSDANYLCRVFKKSVGVTPAKFRAQPWLIGP